MHFGKCCANCEWSISPVMEDNIIEEQHYDINDPNRPKAGDCCLGFEHNDKFVCNEHKYIEVALSNYVLYDNKYIGEGYFIVTEYYDEIIKFFKLYRTFKNGKYNYKIRGYELDAFNYNNKKYVELKISNYEDKELFVIFNNFARKINENIIDSVNPMDKSCLVVEGTGFNVYMTLMKDIQDGEQSRFIDLDIGNTFGVNGYDAIDKLYKELDWLFKTNKLYDEKMIKKILKISR